MEHLDVKQSCLFLPDSLLVDRRHLAGATPPSIIPKLPVFARLTICHPIYYTQHGGTNLGRGQGASDALQRSWANQ
jgi:hypothetical protein